MNVIELDFTPIMEDNEIKRRILETQEDADFSGREIGEQVIYNTGSRLYKSFKDLGLKGKNLTAVLSKSEDVQLKFSSLKERDDILDNKKISARNLSEFHYDGEVFLTHLGRSHKRNFSVGYVKNWSNRIKKYVSKKHGINIAF